MLILTGAYIYIYLCTREREREISVDHSWIRLLVSRGLLRPVCDAAKTCVTPANSPPVTNYRPHFSTTFFHKRIIRTTLIDHPSGGPLWKRIPPCTPERERIYPEADCFELEKLGKNGITFSIWRVKGGAGRALELRLEERTVASKHCS